MSNWERLVWNQRDALLSGLGVTLEICFLAFAGAIVGGLLLSCPAVRGATASAGGTADRVLPRNSDLRPADVGELRLAGHSRLAEHLLHGRLGRAFPTIERIPRRDFPDRNRGRAARPSRSGAGGRHVACPGFPAHRAAAGAAHRRALARQPVHVVKSSTLV